MGELARKTRGRVGKGRPPQRAIMEWHLGGRDWYTAARGSAGELRAADRAAARGARDLGAVRTLGSDRTHRGDGDEPRREALHLVRVHRHRRYRVLETVRDPQSPRCGAL